ncbi:hypothetical protein MBAV_003223, partial [Candidatus Magnetobacterium bavaricum]
MQYSRDIMPVAPPVAPNVALNSIAPLQKTIESKLNHMIKELTTISKDTENEFLDLGLRLQNFSISCDGN